MKIRNWVLAGLFLALAVVLAVISIPNGKVMGLARMASLPAALAALSFSVLALRSCNHRQNLTFEELCATGAYRPGFVPPPPTMPAGLSQAELAQGSLQGAASALPRMATAFEASPMLAWQFQRLSAGISALAAAAEAEEDAAQCAAFAVGYLPSAMQYLAACAAEGCPANGEDTLIQMALACEKQQDALAARQPAGFEPEYQQLRTALQAARFNWHRQPG